MMSNNCRKKYNFLNCIRLASISRVLRFIFQKVTKTVTTFNMNRIQIGNSLFPPDTWLHFVNIVTKSVTNCVFCNQIR